MESRSSAKLMIVCLVVFGLFIASHTLVWGMNKADLVEKMAGEAGISQVSSYSLSTVNFLAVNQGTWLNHPPIIIGGPTQPSVSGTDAYATYWTALPPYNFLWPLWSPALSPTDAAHIIALPLLTESNPALYVSSTPVIAPPTPMGGVPGLLTPIMPPLEIP